MLLVFWICVAACLVSEVFIVRAAVRTHANRGKETDGIDRSALPPVNRTAEIVWALVPAIALAFLLASTWSAVRHRSGPDAHVGQMTAVER